MQPNGEIWATHAEPFPDRDGWCPHDFWPALKIGSTDPAGLDWRQTLTPVNRDLAAWRKTAVATVVTAVALIEALSNEQLSDLAQMIVRRKPAVAAELSVAIMLERQQLSTEAFERIRHNLEGIEDDD